MTHARHDPELDAAGAAPLTRVAAYALVVEHDQILLARVAPGFADGGLWTLPGGGLNFAEDPAHGALRELTEETGLVGEIDALAFVSSWSRGPIPERGWGPFHGIRIIYRAHVTGGELHDEIDESTDQAAWFPLAGIGSVQLTELAQLAIEYLEPARRAVTD
jgi:8-oxo-dGTP diphosphatase